MSEVTVNISGYRQLSAGEQALINRIKAHEASTMELQREVVQHLYRQRAEALHNDKISGVDADNSLVSVIDNAEPARWAAIARTDFQTGFMALVRAVAQPVTP